MVMHGAVYCIISHALRLQHSVCQRISLPCFLPTFGPSFLPVQLKNREDTTIRHPANPSSNVTQSCLSSSGTDGHVPPPV